MKKFIIPFLLLLLLTGCKEKIVGTWRCTTESDLCDFKYDSDGKYYLVDNGKETLRGSWELTESNDTLYLTTDLRVPELPDQPSFTQVISFDDDVLYITTENGKKNKFIRIK